MSNKSALLLSTAVDRSFVLSRMNSSEVPGTTTTPNDSKTTGTSSTPNTSQNSISPEYSGRRDDVAMDIVYGGNHGRSVSNEAPYATPSRRQPSNDAATVVTTWSSAIVSVDATTTLCFPFDLDLVRVFEKHSVSNNTTLRNQLGDENQVIYTIDELQMISREARGQLMELTVSREGRELQRWEHLGTTSTQGSSFGSDDTGSVKSDALQREQQIYSSYPNCRLTTGCIPILPGGRIILISSSKSQNVFVLPKGGWEHDESLPLSALRETLEEAGVTGLLGPPLPSLTYETKKSVNRRLVLINTSKSTSTIGSTASNGSERIVTSESPVSSYHTHNRLTIFPMYVQCIYDHWPEMKRLRRIVTIDEAMILLQHRPEFLYMIRALRDRNLHQIGDTAAV